MMRTRRGVSTTRPATLNAKKMEPVGRDLMMMMINTSPPPPPPTKRRRGEEVRRPSPPICCFSDKDRTFSRKRSKRSPPSVSVGGGGDDYFEALPDDLVVCVLSKLSSSASRPADLLNVLVTCKRLHGLALNPMVLAKASPKCLSVKSNRWSESSHRFMKLCADAGNLEACYILGMIRFYCLENRGSGASLMAKAAIGSHAQALYSLAVIQFNGSGGAKSDKDLRAGVALCARAAFLGHVDALRELGHCLQDGYGVRRNVADGRRFLVQANARELAAAAATDDPSKLSSAARSWIALNPLHRVPGSGVVGSGCPLLSDFGCNVPAPEAHPASKFLAEWFGDCGGGKLGAAGLRMCSHANCGRPETRQHEFRRCSVCGRVNYCSRACQALDWKVRHKSECMPMAAVARWEMGGVGEGGEMFAGGVGDGDS